MTPNFVLAGLGVGIDVSMKERSRGGFLVFRMRFVPKALIQPATGVGELSR